LYVNNNQGNLSPNEFQLLMARQSALANKMAPMHQQIAGNVMYKNKLNQSMNEGLVYNSRPFHNLFPNPNNLNQSLNMENEIEELYEQEDENNVIYSEKLMFILFN